MKRACLFLACAAVGLSACSAVGQEIKSERVGENVLALVHGYSKMIAVATTDGLVVIDTLVSPGAARRARAVIEETFGPLPVKYVINTHGHGDHMFGNQVFAEAVILATKRWRESLSCYTSDYINIEKKCIDLVASLESKLGEVEAGSDAEQALRSQLEQARAEAEDYKGYVFTPPQVCFEGEATLRVGGKTFRIFGLGPAHCSSDTFVIIPEDGILVAGDLVWADGVPPWVVSDGDAANWVAAAEKLLDYGEGIETVVSSHSRAAIGSAEVLARNLEHLREFDGAIREAMRKGTSLEEAKKGIRLERYKDYESEWMIEFCIESWWNNIAAASKKAGE